MPAYRIITAADRRQYASLSDFPSDEVAISDAGQIASREHPSVAIARAVGNTVNFLGAPELSDGSLS